MSFDTLTGLKISRICMLSKYKKAVNKRTTISRNLSIGKAKKLSQSIRNLKINLTQNSLTSWFLKYRNLLAKEVKT